MNNKEGVYSSIPTSAKVILGIIVLFFCFRACGSCSGESSNQSQEEVEKAKEGRMIRDAYDSAKQEMKLQLKSPSTAEFPSPYGEGPKCKVNDDGSVIIQSFVDSQNSFGATIRTNFRCTVNQAGKVSDLVTW